MAAKLLGQLGVPGAHLGGRILARGRLLQVSPLAAVAHEYEPDVRVVLLVSTPSGDDDVA